MIKWNCTREETQIAVKIAQRAVTMAKEIGVEYSQMTALMDIEATHSNGCPLKLQELLDADNPNFAHDVFGIRANINRKTGKLENCFLPRYSKQGKEN
jgi:hypothetical protein